MHYTHGQPWLVNALAHEVTYEMKENRNPSTIITPEKIEIAKAISCIVEISYNT